MVCGQVSLVVDSDVKLSPVIIHEDCIPCRHAVPRELPFPEGALDYSGWVEHQDLPDTHRFQAKLKVTYSNDKWCGELQVGEACCKRELIHIDITDNTTFVVRAVTGRVSCQLIGSAKSNGTLHGEVIQGGVGGGRFKLKPSRGAVQVDTWDAPWESPNSMSERSEKGRASPSTFYKNVIRLFKKDRPYSDFQGHDPALPLPSECSICLDGFSVGDLIKRTSCSENGGHVFHDGCLSSWLKQHNTCPLCRHLLSGLSLRRRAAEFHDAHAATSSYVDLLSGDFH